MRRKLLPVVLTIALTGCASMLPKCPECDSAPTWSDHTTGEKMVIIGFSIVGVIALWAAYDSYRSKDAICVGTNCGRERDPNDPECLPSDPLYPNC